MRRLILALALCLAAAPAVAARIKDISVLRSARDSQLVGYGLVVGLQGSGDTLRNAPFTEQSVQAMLTHLGLDVHGASLRNRNVASVIVTADLSAGVESASRLDVTVSALGDAPSLMGGTLLLTQLQAADGSVYASAQGAVSVTGFDAVGQGETLSQGVPTAGRIPNGAIVEHELPSFGEELRSILELKNPDYATAVRIVDAINAYSRERFRANAAYEVDSRRVELFRPRRISFARFMSEIGELQVDPDMAARVVLDARTGTVVVGQDVQISTVAVTYGTLTVRVAERPRVSQPRLEPLDWKPRALSKLIERVEPNPAPAWRKAAGLKWTHRRGLSMSILNTSVSGMQGNSNWLSSISQNVANANTTGYKNVETDFASLVDQIDNGNADFGGVSTRQVSLAALQGSVISTATPTDLAVQGAGFFVVSDSSGTTYLTRNGSFTPDASGNLVNSAGYYLMAANVQNGASPLAANSLTGLQKVNVVNAGQTATATTTASLTANVPSTATPVAPANLPSTNSAGATYTEATSLVVYDNLGGSHTINLYYTNTGSNTWEVDAFDASKASANAGFPYSSGPLATQTLSFNPTTGALSSGSPLSIAVPNGQTMNLDLSNMTQLAAGFNVTAATANGNAPSGISGVSISTSGSLTFNYANGTSSVAYDIPLANVVSPDNLASVNGGAYLQTSASGPVFLGTAGGAGFGKIEASSLESSTVDLATELTDMIQAQSAYEANSKVFQTGANILDVLNGLKP